MAKPEPNDVRAQLQRLCAHHLLKRGKKQQELLTFLVEEWIANEGAYLSEMYIGEMVEKVPPQFERDANKYGYPRTRGNLGHVRTRLNAYYEKDGYLDRVIIKLNVGSYVPVIELRTTVTGLERLNPDSENLILRMKTALDMRTLRGVMRAFTYWGQFADLGGTTSRHYSNMLFVPFAAASIAPTVTIIPRHSVEKVLQHIRASGFEPWECTFANACIKACYEYSWKEALDLLDIADANSQGEAKYFWWYSALLATTGQMERAINVLDGAVRHFARTSIATRTDLALLQVMAGRYQDAEESLSSSLDFVPAENPLISCHFAILYEAQDRFEDAFSSMKKWLYLADEAGRKSLNIEEALKVDWHFLLLGMLVLVFGRGGGAAAANLFLNQLMTRKAKGGRTSSAEIAVALVGVGRYDEAVEWLTKSAFDEHDPIAMWFHIFPPLRHLYGHSGFHDLLVKLNLPAHRAG